MADDEGRGARQAAGEGDDVGLVSVVDTAVRPGATHAHVASDRFESLARPRRIGGHGNVEGTDLAGEGAPEALGVLMHLMALGAF